MGASVEVLGDSLEEFLVKATGDKALRKLMSSMGEAGRQIAFKVRTASCNKTACVNSFGDEQLAVDMLADKILFETLQYSQVCEQACSEEVPEPLDMGGKGFSVAFDPLDGSSIVDTTVAKLRILFEVAPLALLVEKAGGASSCDGQQLSWLDVPITEWDQRTQICYGSVGEVKRFEEYMYGSAPRFS